jgi:membrane-associated phospholipid phosphatase
MKKRLPATMLLCITLFTPQTMLAEDSIEKNGDKLQLLILTLGLSGTLFYEEGYQGSFQFIQSFVSSQLITEGLKLTVEKERPNGNCCNSFPSGHASKAFMGASFIHKRYGLNYGVPAYIGATYVAYSRVHADKHYVEDVLAGAAIGVLSSFYFTTPYKNLEIIPVVRNGTYGINFNSRW